MALAVRYPGTHLLIGRMGLMTMVLIRIDAEYWLFRPKQPPQRLGSAIFRLLRIKGWSMPFPFLLDLSPVLSLPPKADLHPLPQLANKQSPAQSMGLSMTHILYFVNTTCLQYNPQERAAVQFDGHEQPSGMAHGVSDEDWNDAREELAHLGFHGGSEDLRSASGSDRVDSYTHDHPTSSGRDGAEQYRQFPSDLDDYSSGHHRDRYSLSEVKSSPDFHHTEDGFNHHDRSFHSPLEDSFSPARQSSNHHSLHSPVRSDYGPEHAGSDLNTDHRNFDYDSLNYSNNSRHHLQSEDDPYGDLVDDAHRLPTNINMPMTLTQVSAVTMRGIRITSVQSGASESRFENSQKYGRFSQLIQSPILGASGVDRPDDLNTHEHLNHRPSYTSHQQSHLHDQYHRTAPQGYQEDDLHQSPSYRPDYEHSTLGHSPHNAEQRHISPRDDIERMRAELDDSLARDASL
ncbi:hypothetical protein KEM48_004784 [Puccinia striiformis f. sp. tritici PST-130]|nr:hypothetical protein KEM48_004784 [Puccinia striiformis f. sp. tritici PST-130]